MRENIVSVIIPTYNRADFITETMDSVRAQTYRPLQMIVVDDGSGDATKEVVQNWVKVHNEEEHFKTEYHYQENSGASAARNRGAKAAKGHYLMFLDSDDLLGDEVVAGLMGALQSGADGLAACRWSFLEEKGAHWIEKQGKPLGEASTDLLKKWLGGWYIPPCALLWERSAYRKLGGWDESLAANQDGDLVLRYLVNDGKMAFAEQGKSYYRKHAGRASLSEKRTRETIKAREKVLDKVMRRLKNAGKIKDYKEDLAGAYYFLTCEAYYHRFRTYGDELRKKVKAVDPAFRTRKTLHRWLETLMGTYRKEQLHRLYNYLIPERTV